MVKVLFTSQTGNAKNLAGVIGESLESKGIANEVQDMGDISPEVVQAFSQLVIVASTFGEGEAPDTGSEWMSYLKFEDNIGLDHLKFAVLGLGDTYYPHFCQCGKDFETYLQKHGAKAMVERLDCDLYYEKQYGPWLEKLISVLKK